MAATSIATTLVLLAATVLSGSPLVAGAANVTFRNRAHEIVRGGAWRYHDGAGPCGSDPHRAGCSFSANAATAHVSVAASQAPQGSLSVALQVSKTVIDQLESVNVSVTYSSKYTATALDWIGAYCVDDEATQMADSEFLDYVYANATDSAGKIKFGPLVNMRCSWQFRYFTQNGSDAYVKLATSSFVRFRDGHLQPLHVHAAKTEKANEIRVMWVSGETANRPFVEYGESATKLTKRAIAAKGESYNASDMCEAPATTVAAHLYRNPGIMYSAVIPGLNDSSTYYYRVCSGTNRDDGPCSQVFKLKTPPTPGKQDAPASFFVYGDLGDWTIHATGPYSSKRSAATMELIRRDMDLKDGDANYVAVVHVGDLSYGKGSTYLWDQFGALIQPVAAEIPYMVGIGNHEYVYVSGGEGKDPSGAGKTNGFHPSEGNYAQDSQGECGVPADKRFLMPANGNRMFWWSTEMGLVHHTMISSEHDYTPGSEMYEWLVNDLKSVDRKKTPWLFLHLHRPMYTSEKYESDNKVSKYLRKNLEKLLTEYVVDAVFSGHYHAYELTCPVYGEECHFEMLENGLHKAHAPVHIMVGSAGADIDDVGYYDVPWRVDAQQEYGYGRVHVFNASHAKWEFVRNRDEIVASETWIISDHDWEV